MRNGLQTLQVKKQKYMENTDSDNTSNDALFLSKIKDCKVSQCTRRGNHCLGGI